MSRTVIHNARHRTGWLVAGTLSTFLFALVAVPITAQQENQQTSYPADNRRAAGPQEQQYPDQDRVSEPDEKERSAEWARDNLDMVSASVAQIRDVLVKDPGLMMALKSLLAKQATDRGQIVAEQDLEDDVILDRLATDQQFRALATRLLQRYGYLTPQVNPLSPAGQEQSLLLKARADQLARAEAEPRNPVQPSQMEQARSEDLYLCSEDDTGVYAGGFRLAPQDAQNMCEPSGQYQYGGQRGGNLSPNPYNYPPSPMQEQPGQLPPSPPQNFQRPDLGSSQLLTASAVSSGMAGGAMAGGFNQMPGSLMSQDMTGLDGSSMGSALAMRQNGLQPQYFPYATGGIPVSAPEYAENETPRSYSLRREMQQPQAREPVELVKSPSPYAFVPSLYDLYVQAAPRTGHLERFGLDAFRRVPLSSGIPMDLPAGPDYVLGPGDGLTIDLWGGVSQRLYRTVDREGRLALPEAGPLLVSGKSLGDVQEVVQRLLRTQYRDVSADVSLSRLRTVRVYVVGEVVSPGAYDISALSTPLNALWAAGGVGPRGSLRLLRHSRGNQVVEDVDVYDLLLRGIRGDLKNFEDGDTLLVPPVGAQITVDGMVRRPAIYELHGEINLAQALDLAGGVLPAAALRQIEVQRLEAHEKRTMLSLNIDAASDAQAVRTQLAGFQVHDGDEIHIFPIAPYNSATVYLQGHVLRPGRYAYKPGMTVADLLSSYRDMLPEPAEHYAEIIRLQQPDWRPAVENFDLAASLDHTAQSPQLQPLDTVRIFGRYDVEAPPEIWLYGEVRTPGEYRTTGEMHLRDAIYQAGGLRPDAALDSVQLFRTEADGELKILNVSLIAALNGDPLENVLMQPRDRVIVHRSLYRVDPASVYIKGEVANPGRYPLAENMRLEDLVSAAGGPKRSADLKNGDLTRYQTVSGSNPQGEHERVDLAAISLDTSRDIPLKDGDVLSVPQLPGWNDLGASVNIKGEVKNPGVYGIRPGEHLSSVIERAGGLLPTAYPQGIVFTRVSVRDFQDKSRQELIQRLEQENPQVKAAITTSGAEEAALAGEALQQRDRALEALKRAPVSGRLVIRMRPGMDGFKRSSQDIELRKDDTIEIPKQPGFVLVVGQVYNTNAVTYVPGKNAGWYLAQGGGVTRLGDRGAIFIVRADGEVVSRRGDGMWSGSVLSERVRPGDTLVVPERPITGGARWKNLIAIAQLAEAGAITAAVLP